MRLSIKHATLHCVLITKNPNKNQKPPPPKKGVKNSHNGGKTLIGSLNHLNIGRIVLLTATMVGFKQTMSSVGLLSLSELEELNAKASGGKVLCWGMERHQRREVSALRSRNGRRWKDYGLRGK